MVDSLIKIIDKIMSLVQHKELKRLRLFEDILQPFFGEFEKLVDDHFRLLSDVTHALITLDDRETPSLIDQVRKRRERLLTVRIRVREFARCLNEQTKDPEIKRFFSEATEFFRATGVGGEVFLSVAARIQQDVERLALRPEERESLVQSFESSRQKAQEMWKNIVSQYALLLAKYKGFPG